MTETYSQIIGLSWGVSPKTGKTVYTLSLAIPFPEYKSDLTKGRGCIGMDVKSSYVGDFDCSGLNVGDHVEILYGEAVTLKNGQTFQPIKRIERLD